MFAFSAYAIDKGMNTWIYSLAYNSFVFADIAIAIAVGVIVFSSKAFMKQVRKFSAPTKAEPAAENAVQEAETPAPEAPVSGTAAADPAPVAAAPAHTMSGSPDKKE